MSDDLTELITDALSRLDMVEWDRYVEGHDPNTIGEYVNVYGWIDRPDSHEDFVLLRFMPDYSPTLIAFTTSSDEYTEEIHERIYGEAADGHVACQRVEDAFDVPNVVELDD